MATESIRATAGIGESEKEARENGGDGSEDTEVEGGRNGVFGKNRKRLQRASKCYAKRRREQRGKAAGSLVQQAYEINEACGTNWKSGSRVGCCSWEFEGYDPLKPVEDGAALQWLSMAVELNAGWFLLSVLIISTDWFMLGTIIGRGR